MSIGKIDALMSLVPGAGYVLQADGTLIWMDESITQPTDSAINAEVTRLTNEYDDNKYQRDRAVAFPNIGDQLDLLYKDMLAGKVDSTGEFAKAIKATKDKYPKP